MIGAIEQKYNGYRTRSTLEARWMVFFDNIKLPYYYEYQGYDLGNSWYLPDFYIPKWKCHFEAKDPSIDASTKYKEFKEVATKARKLRSLINSKVIVSFGGFGSDEATRMMVFMPGESPEVVNGLLYGYGIFGECDGIDILYLETLNQTPHNQLADLMRACLPFDTSIKMKDFLGRVIKTLGIEHTRRYLIPLHSSVGFNFSMIKSEEVVEGKIFAPFSDPLLCSINAPYFNKFKPYTEARNIAKQYRFDRRKSSQNETSVL